MFCMISEYDYDVHAGNQMFNNHPSLNINLHDTCYYHIICNLSIVTNCLSVVFWLFSYSWLWTRTFKFVRWTCPKTFESFWCDHTIFQHFVWIHGCDWMHLYCMLLCMLSVECTISCEMVVDNMMVTLHQNIKTLAEVVKTTIASCVSFAWCNVYLIFLTYKRVKLVLILDRLQFFLFAW